MRPAARVGGLVVQLEESPLSAAMPAGVDKRAAAAVAPVDLSANGHGNVP